MPHNDDRSDRVAQSIADSWAEYDRLQAGALALVPPAGPVWDRDDVPAYEIRSDQHGLGADDLADAFGEGSLTRAGLTVGPSQALRVSAAYACRRVISEDVARVARRVVRVWYDRDGVEQTSVEHDHPVHRLLTLRPNDWMTPFEFVQYMVAIATFHPAAYALIQRDARGNITELLPLLPGTCAPEFKNQFWDIQYRITGYGEAIVRQPGDVFVLRGPMGDPWQGHATVDLAREAVGLAAAIEAAQARFHANDLRPSGILTTKVQVSPEQRDAMRRSWQEAYGPGGTGGVAVLDQEFEFKPITAEAAKQEVIENRKFQVSDTCRFFRVFPQIIGHNDGSQSYASVEQMFAAHDQHTIQPWVERFEEAATLALLSEHELIEGLRVDLDMSSLMRGAFSDRVKVYKDAVQVFMTPNEVRIREGLPPIPDPAMNRVQLPANNTGLTPRTPLGGGAIEPEPVPETPPRLPSPPPKKPSPYDDEDEMRSAGARRAGPRLATMRMR